MSCQTKHNSCGACCGLHNLKISHSQLQSWFDITTTDFLSLNLKNTDSIIAFRKEKEDLLSHYPTKESTIYACPFLGWIDKIEHRIGCLLHPAGSPHPQIKLIDNPQNFSFYGQNICQMYDCHSKEGNLNQRFLPYIQKTSGLEDATTYTLFTANYNLLSIMHYIIDKYNMDEEKLFIIIWKYLKKEKMTVTSFEISNQIDSYLVFFSPFDLLGSLLYDDSFQEDVFCISAKGRRRGKVIQRIIKNKDNRLQL